MTTAKEQEQRIERTLQLISEGRSVGQIRQTLKSEFEISRRTCDRILSHAREELLEETGTTIQQQRAEAVAWYRRILTDDDAPLKYRMQAREQLDRLMGLPYYCDQLAKLEASRESNRRANDIDEMLADLGIRNDARN